MQMIVFHVRLLDHGLLREAMLRCLLPHTHALFPAMYSKASSLRRFLTRSYPL
jgi:hypothetical protein